MIRSIQNYPGAEHTGGNGQAVRKDRKDADFGAMLQRRIQEGQAARPESGFEDMTARAAAEAGQAAAIRRAMGMGTGPDAAAAAENADSAAAVSGIGAAGTVSIAGGAAGTVSSAGGAAGTRQTVSFSKHALARAEQRGIELTDTLLDKLADSVERAQEKGAKNILAFDSARAFIINIPYSRVITAISQEEMRENIFTNIDGAVLL